MRDAAESSPANGGIALRGRRRYAVASLTFDDGSRDHRAVAELLAERGLAGTFYVNSNLVGSAPDRLDWDDVAAIAALGHEIGGHTSDHLDLTTLTRDEALAQIERDRTMLGARGQRPVSFAYPFGAFDPEVERLVEKAGYSAARRAWGLAEQPFARNRPIVESLPPFKQFAIRAVPIQNSTSLYGLKRLVTRAARRGGWLPLVFHRISADGSTYDLSPSVFERFVAWLSDDNCRIAVNTVARVLEL